MFRRRWLCWAIGAALALLVGAGVLWLVIPPDTITPENWSRIEEGMAKKDVSNIFGREPDGHAAFAGVLVTFLPSSGWEAPCWIGRDVAIVVYCRDGKVLGSRCLRLQPHSILHRLRSWLGW